MDEVQAQELVTLFEEREIARLKDSGDAVIVRSFLLLKAVEKMCKERSSSLREELLGRVRDRGFLTEKGHKLETALGTVSRSERKASFPPDKELCELLEAHGIDPQSVYDRVTQYVLNPSRVEHLVLLGKLDKDEFEALKVAGETLRVSPAKAMKQELQKKWR